MESPSLVSVVIPVYNGANTLDELVQTLSGIFGAMPYRFEILLVEDFSRDESWETIRRLCGSNPSVKGVRLSRNFGQQIAVSAGIAQSSGHFVILMDCDLQHPVAAIPEILARLEEGNDIVYTVAKERNNWRDELTSRLFWWLIIKVLRVRIVRDQLMMRGMSRRFAQHYDAYPELTRTVAGITNDIGLRHAVIPVRNERRKSGRSNYNFFSRLNLMIGIVLSLSTVPLSYIINVSLLVLLATIGASVYYFVSALLHDVPPGFTSIILLIIGFGSLITLILGIMGVYLANIYTEVRRRPLYIVDEKLNFSD